MNERPNWRKLREGEMDWNVFRLREKVCRSVRTFFQSRKFLEIESPLLTPFPTLDSNIHSLRTDFTDPLNRTHRMYLHTSPEYSMKKLLAAGSGNIFFLGKTFRDREMTNRHNPEFTLVEWYRIDADYRDIQQDTEDLIRFVADEVLSKESWTYGGKDIDLSTPWKRMTVQELFRDKAGIDLDCCRDAKSLCDSAKKSGMYCRPSDDWETLFFRIFLEAIEPGLGFPSPVFVTDYPVRLGLMARRKPDDPEWVERTELYLGGLELANGYTELTDPAEQKLRLAEELRKKADEGFADYRMDDELIRALELDLPPCAGIALGLDRLIMLLADKQDIREVLAFPAHLWMT